MKRNLGEKNYSDVIRKAAVYLVLVDQFIGIKNDLGRSTMEPKRRGFRSHLKFQPLYHFEDAINCIINKFIIKINTNIKTMGKKCHSQYLYPPMMTVPQSEFTILKMCCFLYYKSSDMLDDHLKNLKVNAMDYFMKIEILQFIFIFQLNFLISVPRSLIHLLQP